MSRRTYLHLAVFVTGFALALGALHAGAQQDDARRGRKFKMPPPSSRIEVTVLRASTGKPVVHAAVIFHPIEGDRDKGVLELKTNEDGKAIVDVIPIGDVVRLQIIAKGFQTYGQDFKIDKPEMAMEIRLKRPGEQYSIYRHDGETANSGSSSDAGKSQKPSDDDAKSKDQASPKQP